MNRKSRAQWNNQVIVSNRVSKFPICILAVHDLAQEVLKYLKFKKVLLSLAFVTDNLICRLNQRFLEHSYATDVLAFPFLANSQNTKRAKRGSSGQLTVGFYFLGEVIVSPNQAKIRSKEFQASFACELMRYMCHGILHLAGHQDRTQVQKKQMRQLEDFLMRRFAQSCKEIVSDGD